MVDTSKKISGPTFIDAEAKGKSRLARPGIVKLRKTVYTQAAQADPSEADRLRLPIRLGVPSKGRLHIARKAGLHLDLVQRCVGRLPERHGVEDS